MAHAPGCPREADELVLNLIDQIASSAPEVEIETTRAKLDALWVTMTNTSRRRLRSMLGNVRARKLEPRQKRMERLAPKMCKALKLALPYVQEVADKTGERAALREIRSVLAEVGNREECAKCGHPMLHHEKGGACWSCPAPGGDCR